MPTQSRAPDGAGARAHARPRGPEPPTGPEPSGRRAPGPGRSALATLDEVDDQGDPLKPKALAQAVLEVVRIVAGHERVRVDLDRVSRRAHPGLDHEQQLQA